MQDTLQRYLSALPQGQGKLRAVFRAICDRLSSQATSSAGLVIKAGGGVLAKIGAVAFQGVANGVAVTIAAATDMPSLVGTITQSSFNVFCFFIDSASVVTVAMGTEGTTLALVKFPPFPENKALVGYLIVTNGGGAFVGGTTALDTATTNFVSPIGSFDPTVITG